MNGQQDEDWWSKLFPIESEDQVHGHLTNLNIHKSMGLHEMCLRVLLELADGVAKPIWDIGKVLPVRGSSR